MMAANKGVRSFLSDDKVRYELFYINLSWFFLLIGFSVCIFNSILRNRFVNDLGDLLRDIAFISAGCVYNYLKYRMARKKILFKYLSLYIFLRCIELFIISYASIYAMSYQWHFLIVFFPILVTCLTKGKPLGMVLLAYSFTVHITLKSAYGLIYIHQYADIAEFVFSQEFFNYTLNYLTLAIFVILGGMIYTSSEKKDMDNKALAEQTRQSSENLKDMNSKLLLTNTKLKKSVSELYTIQQVSRVISSMMNIKDLLDHVNNIILDVIGADYSSIMFYDEKKDAFRVRTTNISEAKDKLVLKKNAGNALLFEVISENRLMLEMDIGSEAYAFTSSKEIRSFICVPISTKSRKYGLILAEGKTGDQFDNESLNILNAISQQLSIALENAELYRAMHKLAIKDSLTGLNNRLFFEEELKNEYQRALEENYPISLVIFDIDFFKLTNDTYGHLFGDTVLRQMANIAANSVRRSDTVARYGGEEFVILLPHTSLGDAIVKAEKLRLRIAEKCITEDSFTVSITASFGVSCFPDCAKSVKQLLLTADNALYEAKAIGRNRVSVAARL